MDLVSIITINYNSSLDTLKMLESLRRFVKTDCEAIVVDNASDENQYSILKNGLEKFSNAILVPSPLNLGFGGGNMLGAKQAKGNFLLFINNDMEFLEDSVSVLKEALKNYSLAGLIGPRTIKDDDSFIRGFGHCHELSHSFFGLEAYRKWHKLPDPWVDYKEPQLVDFVVGSFLFFPKAVFEKIGGFDENLFLYSEEMDIGKRLKKIGMHAIYYPKTTIKHYEGKSSNARTQGERIRREQQISHNYYFRKHNSLFVYIIWYFAKAIKFPFKIVLGNRKENLSLFCLHLKGNGFEYSLRQKQKAIKRSDE